MFTGAGRGGPTAEVATVGPGVTDGIGTPNNLVNSCFQYNLANLAFFLDWLSGALVGVGGSEFIG